MTINANFTNEELLILATAKGRVPSITEMYEEEVTLPVLEKWDKQITQTQLNSRQVPSKQTAEEYLTNYYEQVIIDDTATIFCKERTKSLEEQKKVIQDDTRVEMEAKIRMVEVIQEKNR